MIRRDRARAWPLARRTLWMRGVKLAYRRAREGWWDGAVTALLRVAGEITGFACAWAAFGKPWPVEEQ